MPPSIADLEAMVAAGASAQVLLHAIRPVLLECNRIIEADDERRNRLREQSHKRVTRYRALRNALPSEQPLSKKERKKDLPSIQVPSGTSISGRDRKRKQPLPENWNPIIAEADAAELQRFKDYARANSKLYADWDAAWRNWKTSPYRKSNAGQSNGNGHVETFGERCKRLHTAIVEREQELGFGVQATPPDVGGIRSRG
jgi:hypothetical protein